MNNFKLRDKVFDYELGWGEISRLDIEYNELTVDFQKNTVEYNLDGSILGGKPILSFTEYTLEGFSQLRPEPVIEQNTVVYYMNGSNWYTGYYSHRSLHNHHIFDCQQKSGNNIATKPVNKLSLTNPLI